MILRLPKWLLSILLSGLSLAAQEAVAPEKASTNETETAVAEVPKTDAAEPAPPVVTKTAQEKRFDQWERQQRDRRHNRRSHNDDIVQVRGDVTVKEGESVGDIVIIAGKLHMDGEVRGSIVSIASESYINGIVRDSVVVVPGPVTFGPKTEVGQDAVIVGESTADPDAKFGQGLHPVRLPEIVPFINGAKDFLFQGVMYARPLPPSLHWVWYIHGGMFLALLGLSLIFPKPVEYGAEAIAERPVMSMFSGFLTVILFVPVLALISITVIGLPVGILAIIFAALFGKAALMTFLGQQIGRNLRLPFLESRVVAMIVGALVLIGLYMVPIVGFLTWGIATLLGIGSIMVATASALNNRPTIPTPVEPLPTLPGSIPPPTIATEAAAVSVPTYLKRVGFWKRTFAAILDVLLLLIPMILAGGLFPGFVPLILIAYFVAMWTWRGTTIGMICLGLKIVRADGSPIDFAVALVRSLAACFSFVVLFLGFFWAGWDREKQSWHDKIAGTIVVQVPKGVSLL